MVLTYSTITVAIGLVIGTVSAWYLRTAADLFLFRIESDSPYVFAAALGALALAALIASAIPARRAATVSPIVALRAE